MKRDVPCVPVVAFLLGVFGILSAAGPQEDAAPTIRLNRDKDRRGRFEVSGVNPDVLRQLAAKERTREEWTKLFAVYVGDEPKPGQPAVAGTYRIDGDRLIFEPRFGVEAGVRYRAVLNRPDAAPVSQTFFTPKPAAAATTVVEQVYPTRNRLPENQLKFYLQFSAPMSRGEAYRNIRLLKSDGRPVDLPFLELDEELWDPTGKRFTLLFDPGRIKRGLKPREEVGPSLEEGKSYTLVIDRAWEDGKGNPLKATYRKQFRVGPPDDDPPDPKKWQFRPPAAGKAGPLVVVFPEPMDYAMLQRALWVTDAAGHTIPGTITVTDEETRWSFTPAKSWTAGRYALVADTTLEDLAGNSIGRPFEVDVFRPIQRHVKAEHVSVPFSVKSPE